MRRKRTLKQGPIYKEYRIYTSPLMNEHWISMIVSIGKRRLITRDSLTDTVTRVPGEHRSEVGALLATKRYIDEEDAHRHD